MIFKNDRFKYGPHVYLLLHCEPESGRAWAININNDDSWPREFDWSRISQLNPCAIKSDTGPGSKEPSASRSLTPTASMLATRDKALELLGDLIDPAISYPGIFDPDQRGPLVLERAQQAGCSIPTLYKHLRRFWRGGQTRSALLGGFHRCGRPLDKAAGTRGAKTEFGRDIYQLTPRDIANFRKVIETKYLKGDKYTIAETHQRLLEDYYQVKDGNGKDFVLLEGERPTYRQFRYYLLKAYPLEKRLRSRLGDEEFEQKHRPVIGTVMDTCEGVGHYYEADASIVDLYLVAADEIRNIIGKPTIYLIIDRKSRLIVGWYVGLENASWIVAMQAFVSISQDKQEICERLGVEYDPNDWPAHQLFPKHVLGDRGEVFTKASDLLTTELGVNVSNLPKNRPDWKPVVECGNKQTRMILQPDAPGFDPPENATKRQGKRYDKDACMTLREFERIILLAIIARNRRPITDYPLTLKEIGNKVLPIPIELWNHDVAERSGVLRRFDEMTVRMALLPRASASVDEHGIHFNKCYYTCPQAVAKGWFSAARKGVFQVMVAYDRRLVDKVYVFDTDGSGKYYEAVLTSRSALRKGMSFCTVMAIEKLLRSNKSNIREIRVQVDADFHAEATPDYAASRKRLKDAKLTKARHARKVDTKKARAKELAAERKELAVPAQKSSNTKPSASVVPFSGLPKPATAQGSADPVSGGAGADTIAPTPEATVPAKPLTLQELIERNKGSLLNG